MGNSSDCTVLALICSLGRILLPSYDRCSTHPSSYEVLSTRYLLYSIVTYYIFPPSTPSPHSVGSVRREKSVDESCKWIYICILSDYIYLLHPQISKIILLIYSYLENLLCCISEINFLTLLAGICLMAGEGGSGIGVTLPWWWG